MKTKVGEFNKAPIYFESKTRQFHITYAGSEYARDSFSELNDLLSKSTIKPESGYCFVKGYDGIRKAEMVKSWINDYSDEETVSIKHVDNSHHEERVNRKEIYPYSKENIALYEEAEYLKEQGWNLIHKGENLAAKLKK